MKQRKDQANETDFSKFPKMSESERKQFDEFADHGLTMSNIAYRAEMALADLHRLFCRLRLGGKDAKVKDVTATHARPKEFQPNPSRGNDLISQAFDTGDIISHIHKQEASHVFEITWFGSNRTPENVTILGEQLGRLDSSCAYAVDGRYMGHFEKVLDPHKQKMGKHQMILYLSPKQEE